MLPRLLAHCLLLVAACIAPFPAHSSSPPPLLTDVERDWVKQHPVVYFAADDNLPPLEFVEDGQYRGLFSAYLDAISERSGLRFERVPTGSWQQAQQAFNDGRVDLLPNVSPNRVPPELIGKLILSPTYFSSPTVIVTAANAPIITNSHALDGRRVAIRGGGSNERQFAQLFPEIPVLRTHSPDEALQAVVNGHAYATVGTEAVMLPMLRRKYTGILGVSGVLPEINYEAHMGVRSSEPILARIINKSLHSLSAQQTDEMYDQWLEQVDYGAPSVQSLIEYRSAALLTIACVILLLAGFAYHSARLKRVAVASEREKSRFLAVMSHEIRTPMNAIVGSIELLQRTPLSARQNALVHSTATASESLLSLLDDVLDLSKLDAHRLTLETQAMLPMELAQSAIEVASIKAEAKQLPIHVQFTGPQDQHVLADPTRLRQVLANLLGNAVKFTERGCINLDLELDVAPEATATLTVKVSDTGIGIAQADQAKLFQAYSQADDSTTRRFGGTGLGLTICKELVELMGGKIRLDSLPGVGTSVSFSIPTLTCDRPETAHDTVPDGPLVSSSPILIIEDHPENQRLIQEQLQLLGLHSETAVSGLQALELVTHKTYALALMDCHMPGMSGYETTTKIRELEKQLDIPRLPVIAISAATDAEHLQHCMDSGMDGVLSKPLRLTELQGMLHLWLDISIPAMEDGAAPPEPSRSYHQVLVDDVVQLKQCVARSAWVEAFQLAHRIRGAALMFQDDTTIALANSLESLTKAATPDPHAVNAELDKLFTYATSAIAASASSP